VLGWVWWVGENGQDGGGYWRQERSADRPAKGVDVPSFPTSQDIRTV